MNGGPTPYRVTNRKYLNLKFEISLVTWEYNIQLYTIPIYLNVKL